MDRLEPRPVGVGLGYFDGLHRGHMELVRMLLQRSAELGLVPTVLTFDRHPAANAATGRKADRSTAALISLDEKKALLLDSGVSEVVVQPFDADFAAMPAERFLDEYLVGRLGARLVVVGHDYRFGKGRTGDCAFLLDWGLRKGVEVLVTDAVRMGETLIKSTTIRERIAAGQMMEAASLLGRGYSLRGVVKRGRGLATKLGFPTANFTAPCDRVLPPTGIYRTRARVGERTYESVTNLGYRPTIETEATDLLVETCLFDTDLDLYGQTLDVEFLERLREEERFDDVESLRLQVQRDIEVAREMHRKDESGWIVARIDGIPVHLLRTSRFRTSLCTLSVRVPLARETASRNSLLSRILSSSCARLPLRTEVAAELDGQYGADIHSSVEKEGDLQVLHFTADALSRWTDGSSPIEGACSLLFEMLLTPARDERGEFLESIVEEERQNQLAEIASRENDRTRHCIERCTEIFCAGSPHGLEEDGEDAEIRAVTRMELERAYEECFRNGAVQLHLTGEWAETALESVFAALRRFTQRFPAEDRLVVCPGLTPAALPSRNPDMSNAPAPVVERKKVEQARVCLAYEGAPAYYSMDTIVMTVLNSMLGGDAHSLLFEKVREEEGLAYSVFSAPLRYLSGILLCGGVPVERTEEALSSMRRQIEALATDDFPDRIFDSSIRMIESSLRTRGDDLARLSAADLAGISSGRRLRQEETLLLLRSVTRARVVALARRLKERACFVQLPGEETE
jgi:riboflavin kinase/FMN adenylyltransferase